jgi:cyclopropane-fatty-acyl-phospholipid synthase
MTDPVFALEPDMPRNVRSRAGCRLSERPPRRLAHRARRGADFHFGDPAAALRAEVQVCTPEVYWRLLTGGSLAAAEAWMDGDWESHQLTPLLQILARNGEVLGRLERGFRLLGACRAAAPLDAPQPAPQARENIAAHYDLGNLLCPLSG